MSTLEAYFSGKKELFEGLAIYGLDKEWKSCPILHLDPDKQKYEMEDSLESVLKRSVRQEGFLE